jgi:hypothetical protein
MHTYNTTARRLRLLADAVDSGIADPEDVHIKVTGDAELVIVHENEPPESPEPPIWCTSEEASAWKSGWQHGWIARG